MHSINFGSNAIIAGNWDAIYARYLNEILKRGDKFVGRNGETKSLFGCSVTVDLQLGFPLTRLRKMPIKNLFREFLFDIGLSGNVKDLGKAKHFWDFLADEDGELGATAYNRQWRRFPPSDSQFARPNEEFYKGEVDQLKRAILKLRMSTSDRQCTVITTNPTAVDPSCPPCHIAMQFMPRPNGTLDLMVPARSNDMIVGFPLDIARYAIMTHVVAKAVDLKPGRVMMPSANSHIYENCYELARELAKRTVRDECHLVVKDFPLNDIDELHEGHFDVTGYDPYDAMKVAVN